MPKIRQVISFLYSDNDNNNNNNEMMCVIVVLRPGAT